MRILVGIILLVILPGAGVAFSFYLWALWRAAFWPIWLGFGLGLILDHFALRRFQGLEVFEHEFTHALAALLFFRRIRRFAVTTRKGGYVDHSGGFGGKPADDFIGFAPYSIPTCTVLSVLVRPWLSSPCFPWFDIWIGLTLGFHTWSTIREIRNNWNKRAFVSAGGESVLSDIGRRGFVYSFIFISTVTLVSHGLAFAIIFKGYSAVPIWAHRVWKTTALLLHLAFRHVQGLLD